MILIRERGNLVTREVLRHEIWSDDTFVDFEAGLNAVVKRLREVLGDSAASPIFIETLPRRGYRFIAPVEIIETVAGREEATPEPMIAMEAVDGPTSVDRDREKRVVERTRGRRRTLAIVGASVVIAVTLAGLSSRHAPGKTRTPAFEPTMTRLTNLGSVIRASLSPDGKDIVYARSDGIQQSVWLRRGDDPDGVRLVGPLDGDFLSLAFGPAGTIYYTVFSPDRTNIGLYRVSAKGEAPEAVLDASGPIAFSPDQSRYARIYNLSSTTRESQVILTNATTDAALTLTVRRTPESFVMLKPAWSPDGTRLALFAASDGRPGTHDLVSIDVSTGAIQRIAELKLAQVEGAIWLPDGGALIVSGREVRASPQRLWSVRIGSGTVHPLTSDVSDYSLVGITPDGSRVLAVRLENTRSLWAADVGAPERATRLAADAGSMHGYDEIGWAPDGQILYTLAESGNADVWSLDPTSGRRQRLTVDQGDDFHPAVSPDGRTVVFGSNRSGTSGLWSMSRDGSNVTRLTTGGDSRPSFSPDGEWVAFQRSGVETTPWMVWRVWLRTKKVERVGSPSTIRPAVSPDGRFVAHYWMTSERWLVAVTPAEGGVATAIFPVGPTHRERTLRWSADGQALAFIDTLGGAANIWTQRLDRSPAQKLTNFSDGTIATFDWSRDGSKLAWMRVHEVRDIVAITLPNER